MRVTINPPLSLVPGDDHKADVADGMRSIVRTLEAGIRATPDQWFALTPLWGS